MRHASPLAVVLALASAALAQDPSGPAGQAIADLDHETRDLAPPQSFTVPDHYFAPPEIEAASRGLADQLASPYVRLTVNAFRVTSGGNTAGGLLAGDVVKLSDEQLETIRGAIRSGALVPVGRVTAVGAADEPLSARDESLTAVALMHDVECNIGSAIGYPIVTSVRSGLAVEARAAPHFDGATALAFNALVVGEPTITPTETIGGTVDRVAADAFVAQGSAVLAPGETVCVRGIDSDGAGFAVLLRIDTENAPSLPLDLGSGWVALPRSALDAAHAAPSPWVDEGWRGYASLAARHARWSDPLTAAPRDSVSDLLMQRGIDVDDSVDGLPGVFLAKAGKENVAALAAKARDVLVEGGVCSITLRQPETGRIVVPFVDGYTAGAFLGRVGTRTGEVDAESGCDTCIAAMDRGQRTWRGLSFFGIARREEPFEIDASARSVHSEETRRVQVRRVLPDHSGLTQDDAWIALDADAMLRFRTHVPEGGGALPGRARAKITGRPRVDSLPRTVSVGGEPLHLVQGGSALLFDARHTPRVLGWDKMNSCGMTLRYPIVTPVREGIEAAVTLRLDDELDMDVLDVAATITGDARVENPAFDMGDGVVEIVRVPHLAVKTTVPLGPVARVAWHGNLELRVGDKSSERRRPVRTARLDSDIFPAVVRFVEGAEVLLDAGGATSLPSRLTEYTSNHESGEATTALVAYSDGVFLALEPAEDGVSRGHVEFRSLPERRTFALLKHQAPRRPDREVNLVLATRSVFRWPIAVVEGRPFERASGVVSEDVVGVTVTTAEALEEDE